MTGKVKPWCNYAVHRTTSDRKGSGRKNARISRRGLSTRRAYRRNVQWWQQRG